MPSSLYAKPPLDALALFGDLFVADFLFDAWLEEDAALLGAIRVRGGYTAYATHAAVPEENHLLARGRVPVAAMLVNDDCYAARVFERKESSRLQFIPVFALDRDPTERERQLSTSDYTFFPLRPDAVFEGGIAHLNCPFGFDVPDDAARERLLEKRVAQLSTKLSHRLEHRVGAHVARRGMLVASTTRKKLEALLSAAPTHKAAANSVSKLLSTTWSLEGGIADRIDVAAERGESPEVFLGEITEWVDEIARAATEARDALTSVGTATP